MKHVPTTTNTQITSTHTLIRLIREGKSRDIQRFIRKRFTYTCEGSGEDRTFDATALQERAFWGEGKKGKKPPKNPITNNNQKNSKQETINQPSFRFF